MIIIIIIIIIISDYVGTSESIEESIKVWNGISNKNSNRFVDSSVRFNRKTFVQLSSDLSMKMNELIDFDRNIVCSTILGYYH